MICPKCKNETEEIASLEDWLEIDLGEGNLITSEYHSLMDYMDIHPDEICCRDCYENLKGKDEDEL
jgi:hypothetical protein